MNLLEHHILEILEEEKIKHDGDDYYKVTIKVDCYGCIETKQEIFSKDEWEKVKNAMCYVA